LDVTIADALRAYRPAARGHIGQQERSILVRQRSARCADDEYLHTGERRAGYLVGDGPLDRAGLLCMRRQRHGGHDKGQPEPVEHRPQRVSRSWGTAPARAGRTLAPGCAWRVGATKRGERRSGPVSQRTSLYESGACSAKKTRGYAPTRTYTRVARAHG